MTVAGGDLGDYAKEPRLDGERLVWEDAPQAPLDETMLRPHANPFQPDGGMRLVRGNLGRGTFKTSAVDRERWTIEAPCRIFDDQDQVTAAFKAYKGPIPLGPTTIDCSGSLYPADKNSCSDYDQFYQYSGTGKWKLLEGWSNS